MVTVEVLLQRPAHDGPVAVSRERTGQDTDISERTLERLVEDIRDFVFKVLRRDQRIRELVPARTEQSVNLTACTTKVLVVIEALPERKKRFMAWFRSGIDQNTYLWVQDPSKGIKQPAMGIDFFAVLLLQAEDHLYGREIRWIAALRADQLQ